MKLMTKYKKWQIHFKFNEKLTPIQVLIEICLRSEIPGIGIWIDDACRCDADQWIDIGASIEI